MCLPRPRPSESSDTPNGSPPEHRDRHAGLPLPKPGVLRVLVPFGRVAGNILPYSVKFNIIADDPFIIIALPQFARERRPMSLSYSSHIFVGCHRLKPLDDLGQGRAGGRVLVSHGCICIKNTYDYVQVIRHDYITIHHKGWKLAGQFHQPSADHLPSVAQGHFIIYDITK